MAAPGSWRHRRATADAGADASRLAPDEPQGRRQSRARAGRVAVTIAVVACLLVSGTGLVSTLVSPGGGLRGAASGNVNDVAPVDGPRVSIPAPLGEASVGSFEGTTPLQPQFLNGTRGDLVAVDAYGDPLTGDVRVLALISTRARPWGMLWWRKRWPALRCTIWTRGHEDTAMSAVSVVSQFDEDSVSVAGADAREEDSYYPIWMRCGATTALTKHGVTGVAEAVVSVDWVPEADGLRVQPDSATGGGATPPQYETELPRVAIRMVQASRASSAPTPAAGLSAASAHGGVHAVCVRPLYDDGSGMTESDAFYDRLWEWLEWHRLIGVSRIHFYLAGAGEGPSRVRPLLRWYEASGLVAVHDWRGQLPYAMWQYGQDAALHDCIFQSMRAAQWVHSFDVDEWLMLGPQVPVSARDALLDSAALAKLRQSASSSAADGSRVRPPPANALEVVAAALEANSTATTGGGMSAYLYTAWWHCQDLVDGTPTAHTFLGSRTGRHVHPQGSPTEATRTKTMYRPLDVISAMIHRPHRVAGAQALVPPELLRLNHFRADCEGATPQQPTHVDTTATQYDAVLDAAVRDARHRFDAGLAAEPAKV